MVVVERVGVGDAWSGGDRALVGRLGRVQSSRCGQMFWWLVGQKGIWGGDVAGGAAGWSVGQGETSLSVEVGVEW